MKNDSSNEMNCFLQCRRQIFTEFELFAEKVILELKWHKITSLELLRTPILCLVQTKQIMRMRGHRCSKASSQSEKVAKCNFKSKASTTWKIILSNEINFFCNAEDRFSPGLSFFAEKVILELNCTKSTSLSF